jgi:hypothetical protein
MILCLLCIMQNLVSASMVNRENLPSCAICGQLSILMINHKIGIPELDNIPLDVKLKYKFSARIKWI